MSREVEKRFWAMKRFVKYSFLVIYRYAFNKELVKATSLRFLSHIGGYVMFEV